MDIVEKGILVPSTVYFHTHSEVARDVFFYPLCTGHFFCDSSYAVERGRYDSFLVLYVARGNGYLDVDGQCPPLRAGSLSLVDCYRPHCYGTDESWEIYWLHFDGVLARRYFDLCTQSGIVTAIDGNGLCFQRLQMIFQSFHAGGKVSEAMLSKRITDLLTQIILCCSRSREQPASAGVVEETLSFIAENLAEPLTLEALAEHVSLSPFYFLRRFKKETGFTPHEYIIRARVDKAKCLLKTTRMPLKEIAGSCGFSNPCTFSGTFKKISGSTPLTYRNEEPRT